MINIKLLKHQNIFLQSDKQHTVIVGGFRSGKSFIGAGKTINKLITGYKENGKKLDVAYYLPTYDLVKRIAYPEFKRQLQTLGFQYKANESDKVFKTAFGDIIFRSMDSPSSIMGYEVHYSLVDEIDRVHKNDVQEAFDNIIARNSAKTISKFNSTDLVSTPEGYGFLYNFCNKYANSDKIKIIKARTKNNPFIHDEYINSLKDMYSPSKLLAYLEGEFVNLTSGNVYNEFSREVNQTDREATTKDILHIGMDFNVTKMNAVVHVIDGAIAKAVDEIVNKYDTRSMCQYIKEIYPSNRIVVYPDASGGSRKTSSSETDLQIIKSFGFMVKADEKNPFVKDRVNTMNNCFHKNNYQVNTNRCPTYTQALEQLGYKNGEPDKQSGHDHITEAGGYFVHQIFSKKTKVYL